MDKDIIKKLVLMILLIVLFPAILAITCAFNDK